MSEPTGFTPLRLTTLRAGITTLLGALAYGAPASAQTYAPWLKQIGLTNTVASAANWGYGQVLGVVDTGINATHPQFAPGQVSQTLSSCAALSFKCANGAADDNGHGTAVASIAAGFRPSQFNATYGGYTTSVGNLIGVAPSANIVAEKVLNAAGSGYSTDVTNGIRKAADAGAGVINVSITYGNDTNTVAAINYATSKGAFIVWAGGNSAQNLLSGASTTGLTASAIQHLIFAGSVNSANVASSFTNKPGAGALVSTTGAKTAYTTRWIMAPGETILAPITTAGNSAYGFWSGTSMSAPIVSGSLMLLQNAWPILKTNGTTANLLLATSTDLGTKGSDVTYGTGLVNLTQAFQPYGTLTVTKANGQSVAVTSLTGALISSGALGSLSAIQSKLANYTSFDGYARNFSVNLSGLIKSPTGSSSLNALPTSTVTAPRVMKYAGGELTYSFQTVSDPTLPLNNYAGNTAEPAPTIGYTTFASSAGAVTGFGYGVASTFPFAKALFNDDTVALTQGDFDLSGISSLAQRGYQFSYGAKAAQHLRIAVGYSSSPTSSLAQPWLSQTLRPNVQAKLGVSYQFADNLTTGLTYSNMSERSSMLGASYESSSIMALGQNKTDVIGLNTTYRLTRDSSLLLNAEFGRTRAASGGSDSLLAGTTALQSRAFGIAFAQRHLWQNNDQLTASVKQPLRVSAGSAALLTANVDADGRAVAEQSWTSLVPNGREIDFTLNYRMPVGKRSTLALQGTYQKDALNIAGNHQTQIGLVLQSSF